MTHAPAVVAVVLLACAAAGYLTGVRRLRRRGDSWPVGRVAAALGGGGCLAVAGTPPVGDSDVFPVHVTQHLLLAMVAPLLLALSAPVTLALRTLPRRVRQVLLVALHSRIASALTALPVALALDVGGTYAYYLTGLFRAAEDHPWLHAGVHLHMLLSGCLFSWCIVARDPMPGRSAVGPRLAVLLVAAAAHDILSKIMYARLLPAGAGTADQLRAGAQLLYYGGDAVEVLLAVAVLSQWYARTGRRLRHDERRGPALATHRASISSGVAISGVSSGPHPCPAAAPAPARSASRRARTHW